MKPPVKTLLVLAWAASLAVGVGQYYPYGYPFYPPTDPGYGYPTYPYYGGNVDYTGQVGNILADLQAQQAYYMNQMDQIGQGIQAKIAEYDRYFIDLYRRTTGDATSPDAYALEAGKMIHCQQYPVDCQIALQNSQASLAAQQASFDSWMAGVKERDQANDAAFSSWMQQQDMQQAQHSEYVRGAILGLSEYGSTETGSSYYLPYAPSQGSYYQTPSGLPLVFDQARGAWYQLNTDGTYTPYYEVP